MDIARALRPKGIFILFSLEQGLLLIALSMGLVGCEQYEPLPLNKNAELKRSIAELDNAEKSLPNALTLYDVEMLALRNNPDLSASRRQRDVAEAQILEAGILPNPSVSGDYGFLLAGTDTYDAVSGGLNQDLRALLLRPSKKRGAIAAARQIDASLLWQEWQTIAKVRLLYVQIVEGERSRSLLAHAEATLRHQLSQHRQAVAEGDLTLAQLEPDLAIATDVGRQEAELERLQESRRVQLDNLLGLAGTVVLPLDDVLIVPAVDGDAIDAMLSNLADRRPDMIALQYGYRSEEEKLHGAILAQFPSLLIGVSGGRDTADIRTAGPQVVIDLPIFDRNQGNIAIERATRAQLFAEFSARLAQAKDEIGAMLAEARLLTRQLDVLTRELTETRLFADRMENAYREGDIDNRTYLDMVAVRLAKEQQRIALEQSLLEQQVAVAALLGAGLPMVTASHDKDES